MSIESLNSVLCTLAIVFDEWHMNSYADLISFRICLQTVRNGMGIITTRRSSVKHPLLFLILRSPSCIWLRNAAIRLTHDEHCFLVVIAGLPPCDSRELAFDLQATLSGFDLKDV